MEEEALGVQSLERLGPDAGSGETQSEKTEVETSSASVRESEAWMEGVTDDGQTYYYNTVTGVAQWEMAEGFRKQKKTSEATEAKNETSTSCPESSWEKPEEYSPLVETSSLLEEQERRDSPSPKPEPFSGDKDSLTDKASDVEDAIESQVSKISESPQKEEKNSQSSGNGELEDKNDDGDDNEEDKPAPPEDEEEEEEEGTPAKKARTTSPSVNREQTKEEQAPTEPGDLLEVKVREDTESTREVSRKRKTERKV
ncbi:hypothetical protein AAFF_G00279250 [Aldrovandia affinis]|uniref:WW domain-containing protein n=1 Tax=Aldrovandia affinis TaxID=143900 RepID=A0AAD7WS30_9TELE|nr:hypothetical protein AAFF_G00279250 [Aldrovandia affinis]